MSKFKVGDIVRGTSDKYGVTNTYMTKGKIIKINQYRALVEVLEHKNYRFLGAQYNVDLLDIKLAEPSVEKFRGLNIEKSNNKIVITIGEQVVAIPADKGIGISALLDGEDYVEEIGKALAFYRHQTGGSK